MTGLRILEPDRLRRIMSALRAVDKKGAVLEGEGKRPARWRRDLRSEGLKNQFHIVGDARECRTNRSVLLETK
jgi:hypothetical protein